MPRIHTRMRWTSRTNVPQALLAGAICFVAIIATIELLTAIVGGKQLSSMRKEFDESDKVASVTTNDQHGLVTVATQRDGGVLAEYCERRGSTTLTSSSYYYTIEYEADQVADRDKPGRVGVANGTKLTDAELLARNNVKVTTLSMRTLLGTVERRIVSGLPSPPLPSPDGLPPARQAGAAPTSSDSLMYAPDWRGCVTVATMLVLGWLLLQSACRKQ